MLRLAIQAATEGGYDSVTILSTPKTITGGVRALPHFKVLLIGADDGRNVEHEHLIFLVFREDSGYERRYQMHERDARYDYSKLIAKNGPPGRCPRKRRQRRESVTSSGHASSSYTSASYDDTSSSATNRDSSTTMAPNGWYTDPWTLDTGMTL
ncbi:hypothetical protein F4782DRAFT_535923 [Xylaria castorea]|nr:hypothetical protein F4782DRAFT_535923 [Xylaria castorea]